MESQNPVNTSDFLKETIKKRPMNRRRIVRRAIEVALLAVLFGLIACATMILVSPILEERLFPTPTNEVTFTEESASHTSEEVQPEDMILEDKPEPEIILIEEAVDSETQLLDMASLLKERTDACKQWLVQVTGQFSEVSWLDSISIKSDITAGAVIADNGTEFLILVEQKELMSADAIMVTFFDTFTVQAYSKGQDINSGMMVVAVSKDDISEEILQEIQVAKLASSNNKSLSGSVVMALGSPNGISGSVNYGFITSVGVEVSSWDSNYRLLMTDIYGCSNPNGFLVNMDGQILGILRNSYNTEDTRNLISAVGITELKKSIEMMSNQEHLPYLGVKGTDVTQQAHDSQNIPYGAYITGVKLDSPAMQAGLQAGDVIVQIEEKDISSMYTFTYNLYQMKAGDAVTLVVMRQSQGEYKESTLQIVLSSQ